MDGGHDSGMDAALDARTEPTVTWTATKANNGTVLT